MDTATGVVLAAAIPSVLILVEHRLAARDRRQLLAMTQDTHDQVVTLNESTIGQLAAAEETRRAEAIAHDARTAKEQRHIDASPEEGPAQGPAR